MTQFGNGPEPDELDQTDMDSPEQAPFEADPADVTEQSLVVEFDDEP